MRGDPAPRVAYVMSRFPKLTETFVLNEILAVRDQGIAVELYPLIRQRESVVHPHAGPLVAEAHYQPFLSPAIVASNLRALRADARRYITTFLAVLRGVGGSLNFTFGALGVFPKVVHMARDMEVRGVSHVHCHFANHPAVAGFIVQRLTGIPFSFTAHGSDLHVDRHMLPAKVAEAAFVATVSEDNRRLILDECGEQHARKVHVVRCGVDTEVFRPGSRTAGTTVRILCVGTLHEVKGQMQLVDACQRLAAAGVDFWCGLVGPGPDRARLQAAITAAGLQDRVELMGRRTSDEVVELMAGADLLVAPSVATRRGKREGIPVVLIEAMAAGLPVVASRLSGIPELVEDGRSGILVPPGDIEALASATRRLADDPELRQRLGHGARQEVLRAFDLHGNAARLVTLFGQGVAAR